MATVSEFPTLSTDRLTLRAVTPDDAPAFRALLSIPEVTRFSNWPDGPTEEEGRRFVTGMSESFPNGTGCGWIIEERGSTAFVGAIRYNYFVRDWCCAGVGYEIHPQFWGRGVMTEALRAVIACGHQVFGVNRMEAWTLPGNGASDRVLEKAGFRLEGILRQKAWFKGRFHDFRWFGRVSGDPLA